MRGDDESCYDNIHSYLNCKSLVELEDQGYSKLLYLEDIIDDLVTNPIVTDGENPQGLGRTDPLFSFSTEKVWSVINGCQHCWLGAAKNKGHQSSECSMAPWLCS